MGSSETALRADNSYCALQSAVGFMLTHEPDPIRPKAIRKLRRTLPAVREAATAIWRTVARTSTAPLLPTLILGVLAATFFFAFVLNAPRQLIFGIVCHQRL
jgi:hypothetical protein